LGSIIQVEVGASIAFSPDSRTIVTVGDDGAAYLWDAVSGYRILLITDAHVGPILAVSFSPDGRQFVTGGSDGRSQVWDATSGQLVFALDQSNSVIKVARFSPNGAQLATATADGHLRLWDANTGAILLEFQACLACAINSVAWRSDGTELATAGDDGFVRQWQVWPSVEAALAEADYRAGRKLSEPERYLYQIAERP